MSPAADSFAARCSEAAKRFLQTVVVIDNQAEYRDVSQKPRTASRARTELRQMDGESAAGTAEVIPSAPSRAIPAPLASEPDAELQATPQPDYSATKGGATVGPVPEADESEFGHGLNAKKLTDAFCDRSILCTVYRPGRGEDMVLRAAKIASHADIVVVDWHLERGSSLKAKEIIAEILRGDEEHGGRLRLIAVYTAQPGLPQLARELKEHLSWQSLTLGGAGGTELDAPGIRIVFLQKAGSGLEGADGGVAEEDVPARLVQEFAKLNAGVLSTVALQSIAAIREGSHHILSIFHSRLDAAFVLHRCLLPHPEDAEAFVVGLISAELGFLLDRRNVGGDHANIEVLKGWVAANQKGDSGFPVGANLTISVDDVCLWLTRGKNAKDMPGLPGKRNFDVLAEALYGGAKEARERCLEFARISSLKREAFGRRSIVPNQPPALGLGTILRPLPDDNGKLPGNLSPDTFLLCTQPACDSVRIQGKRSYPFQRIKRADDLFNTVVKLKDGSDATLLVTWFPFLTEMFPFQGASAEQDFVIAAWETDRYLFTDVDGNRFEWLADLKDFTAQWAVSQLGARIGSVGIDPFEWLRRKGEAKSQPH